MNINLANFQLKAIKSLIEGMEENKRDVVLKSPTGSGKTIILTHFMDEYLKGNPKTVFIWLTPGKGSLEEQSKQKMDLYIHNSQTKLLSDVMTTGFDENDCCFINWEKLTKKGNNALKDSERTNFLEWIEKAINNGLSFKVIIDESHQNFTAKADEIVQYFKTDKIIRCSATPIILKNAKLIEITEEEVINEGLIKRLLVINEDFPSSILTNNQTEYLLDKALIKQREIREIFKHNLKDINPLIVVQLPNNSDALLDSVENYFEKKGIRVDNGLLAIWLSNRHDNIENINKNNNDVIAVIIKQAVATGWDCPRAHILVKLRENMDETFEIQTIGRIRRMPEAKHYNNDVLDSCYLYTFDSKFTQGVKTSLGKFALESKTIFLKNEHKNFTLIKEHRSMITDIRDPKKALSSIAQHMKQKFDLTGDKKLNQLRLISNGFVFSDDIIRYSLSGKVVTYAELSEENKLNVLTVNEPIDTHRHGRDYHNRVGRIGLEIGMSYENANTIMRKLFSSQSLYSEKIIALEPRQLYAFGINNFDILRHLFREAMAVELSQLSLEMGVISEKRFTIPQKLQFTYDLNNKVQELSSKNVYNGYLLSAEPRSSSEKKFEKYCEKCSEINWIYKNGDKGDEYLSIVYLDNANHQKLFYPDYIVSYNNEIWIIETKGGFDKTGASEDIDIFSAKKFSVLKAYLNKHNLKGGFVRYDKQSEELCICLDEYNDDITSSNWELLKNIFK